jgi:hypothetical protein
MVERDRSHDPASMENFLDLTKIRAFLVSTNDRADRVEHERVRTELWKLRVVPRCPKHWQGHTARYTYHTALSPRKSPWRS